MDDSKYQRIWQTVLQIPVGKVASYGQIADFVHQLIIVTSGNGFGRGVIPAGRAITKCIEVARWAAAKVWRVGETRHYRKFPGEGQAGIIDSCQAGCG